MNVQLAYLRSYVGMGRARVACAGCSCREAVVDAHHELKQSTIFLTRLTPTQAHECNITVTVLGESGSGGHKFKVSGAMANEFAGESDGAEGALNK